jgi:hypothetical protein
VQKVTETWHFVTIYLRQKYAGQIDVLQNRIRKAVHQSNDRRTPHFCLINVQAAGATSGGFLFLVVSAVFHDPLFVTLHPTPRSSVLNPSSFFYQTGKTGSSTDVEVPDGYSKETHRQPAKKSLRHPAPLITGTPQ